MYSACYFDFEDYSYFDQEYKTVVYNTQNGYRIINKKLHNCEDDIEETKTEKVIRFLKGDFEKHIGMTFEEFISIRNEILTNCPEKLI